MKSWQNPADLAGRVLMVILFLLAAFAKIRGYAGTEAYMASAGVPASLLPLVILTELGGSVLILLGLWTRLAAFLLAGFTLLAGAIFHHTIGNAIQQLMLLKDISIAGGFLVLVAHGAGDWSLDARRRR
ncbi:MAG TPA: DoxX family protein [Steroidobacteraceae bacterium]|nr:DoxX family protein [Steroidobacteraceae bacterium]